MRARFQGLADRGVELRHPLHAFLDQRIAAFGPVFPRHILEVGILVDAALQDQRAVDLVVIIVRLVVDRLDDVLDLIGDRTRR